VAASVMGRKAMARCWQVAAAGAVALAGFSVVSAQQDDRMWRPEPQPEAIIYREVGYQGSAVNVSEPQRNLGLAWNVKSIRVRAGRWELCERPNFRGTCRTYQSDVPMIGQPFRGMVVQSMRPLGWNPPGEPGGNPSLRGMASEFFPAPARGGYRVAACPTGTASAACAQRNADRFCAESGWRRSARQMMETVRGRAYLADVLCTNA